MRCYIKQLQRIAGIRTLAFKEIAMELQQYVENKMIIKKNGTTC